MQIFGHILPTHEELVIRCARPFSEENSVAHLQTAARNVDWQAAIRWAMVHGLAVTLYERCAVAGAAIPEDVRPFLHEYAGAVRAHGERLRAEAIRLQAAFTDAGLAVMHFSEVWLTHGPRSAELGARPMAGLDLFARESQLDEVISLLAREQYLPHRPELAASSALRRAETSLAFAMPGRRFQLELRWALPGRRAKPAGMDEVWNRRAACNPGDTSLTRPDATDLLLLLAMQGAEAHWNLLSMVFDFARAARMTPDVDWGMYLARAASCGARKRAQLAAHLAQQIAALQAPEQVARASARERGVAAIAKRVFAAHSTPQNNYRRTKDDLRWDLGLLDSVTDRARYLSRFVFTPTIADEPAASGAGRKVRRAARLLGTLARRPVRASAVERRSPQSVSAFVPTEIEIVDAMLALAGAGSGDVVYDLGCGDGRMVIRAAQTFGARAVGIDLDPARIRDAQANAQQAGVEGRVRFVQGDLMAADLREATVVTMFLPAFIYLQLGATLAARVHPGTRVVSEGADTGVWDEARVANREGFPLAIYLRRF